MQLAAKPMAKTKRLKELKGLGIPLTPSVDPDLFTYDMLRRAKAKVQAKQRRDARGSVQAKRAARLKRRTGKEAAKEARKRMRAQMREARMFRGRDLGGLSSPLIRLIMERREKAAKAGLAKRMLNPSFAQRYKKKMTGRAYRQRGRLLGQEYRTPFSVRKARALNPAVIRSQRKQGGLGMKLKTGPRREGVYEVRPNATESLIEYARKMRDQARQAYVARKIRQGLSPTVRTPMTTSAKKKKRATKYRAKKWREVEAQRAAIKSLNALLGSNPAPSVGMVSGEFSAPRTSPLKAMQAAKRAPKRRASVPVFTLSRPITRSSLQPRRSARLSQR